MVRYFMLNQDLQGIRKVAVNEGMFNMHSALLLKWNQFLFNQKRLILTRHFVMNEKRKSVDFRILKDLIKCSQYKLKQSGTRAGSKTSVHRKDIN